MSEPAVAAKSCTVCGIDCSGRPRVKDQQGRYMCQECFDRAKHTKQVQKAPPPPSSVAQVPVDKAAAVDLRDNSFLLDLGGKESAGTSGNKACPECARSLSPSAVICIGCGYNLNTGKRLPVKVERAKKQKESGPGSAAAELGTSTLFCVVGGLIGGALGAGIWAAIAHFTGLEVGYVAVLVGGMTGAGCSLGARGYAGATSGMLACAIALVAMGVGRYIAVSMLLQQLGMANLPASEWFPKTLGPIDILWAALAIGAAWGAGTQEFGSK